MLAFAIGGIAGFILISKLIAKLLAKFEAQTYYGVGGMILGAIIILFVQGVMTDPEIYIGVSGKHDGGNSRHACAGSCIDCSRRRLYALS